MSLYRVGIWVRFIFIHIVGCLLEGFMDFYLARWMKNSGYCSLEKELWICSNSSFRFLGEQILRALRNAAFCFIALVWIKNVCNHFCCLSCGKFWILIHCCCLLVRCSGRVRNYFSQVRIWSYYLVQLGWVFVRFEEYYVLWEK